MINYREILRLKSQGFSNSRVATSIGSSRNTVAAIWRLAQEKGIAWPLPDNVTNGVLKQRLYPEQQKTLTRKEPDFEYMFKELAKPGVNLTLLWAEYCEACAQEQLLPYQRTQFSEKYREFAKTQKATLRIKHKPGEAMEVDWAKNTIPVYDALNRKTLEGYLFIACLSCSLYCYAEAFPDMRSAEWLRGHIHAYEYYGGVTRILVPDNLKTGVIKHTPNELKLNRSYQEMAEYYGTAIVPARPRKPQDKPNVESSVGDVETWILAALRKQKFFSFEELNQAIRLKLEEYNSKPFQKRKGSRKDAFEMEEKSYLMPLPASPYEAAVWSAATIQPDYLIAVGNCKYSVPYEYIGKRVEVRVTEKTVEVFYKGMRIASHIRHLYEQGPVYQLEHMPEKHQKYLKYNAQSFQTWANDVGDATGVIIRGFLTRYQTPQQGYQSCASMMKLADQYSTNRLENACKKALVYTPGPDLKMIRTILKNGQDRVSLPKTKHQSNGKYGITRGRAYYAEGGDDE